MLNLAWQYLRSTLFLLGMVLSTIIMLIPCLLAGLFPYPAGTKMVGRWNRFNLWWLGVTCNLHYRVTGLENIPPHTAIIMSNHQSTWETIAFEQFFPPLTWVVKRELLWIPMFGWGLAVTAPIALDRKAGKKALVALVKSGMQRLEKGRWIIIFPEGTRTAPGTERPLKVGGFMLASKAKTTIVPVAHNAGRYWARKQFLKKPGIIDVVIGKPIDCSDKKAEQIKEEYQQWLQQTRTQINA